MALVGLEDMEFINVLEVDKVFYPTSFLTFMLILGEDVVTTDDFVSIGHICGWILLLGTTIAARRIQESGFYFRKKLRTRPR